MLEDFHLTKGAPCFYLSQNPKMHSNRGKDAEVSNVCFQKGLNTSCGDFRICDKDTISIDKYAKSHSSKLNITNKNIVNVTKSCWLF